jgi:hypothetical protein
MSVITEVETLLTTQSNVYIGNLPATPDNVICVRLTGGSPRSLSGTYVEEPSFQIMIRNSVYATGEALCTTVKGLLHGQTTTKLLMVQQQGDILYLGRDENNRHEWSLNFRAYYRN